MNKLTNQSNSTQDTEDVVARLNDEAMRLQGRGIDRGCVDSSLAGNLALEAADLIQSLSDRIDVLEGALREGKAALQLTTLVETREDVGACITEIISRVNHHLDSAALHQEGIAPSFGAISRSRPSGQANLRCLDADALRSRLKEEENGRSCV